MKGALLALLLLPAAPAVETHTFLAKWQPHYLVMGPSETPGYSYSTSWSIEVPAPTSKPVSVSVRALSKYVFKYTVLNFADYRIDVAFRDRTWITSMTLEGVELLSDAFPLSDLEGSLAPHAWFWGPDRKKARDSIPLNGSASQGFPDPSTDTWTLVVSGVTYSVPEGTGPAMFGQSLRQRVKGTVAYRL